MAPSVIVEDIFEYLKTVTSLQSGGLTLWFRGVANPDHHLVPGLVWRNEMERERNYVHAFLVSYRAYVSEVPDNPWDLYGLMQHHGLPTRLLDWSASPLHALYFALTQEPQRDGDRAVWVLPPHELNERTLGVSSVFCPGGMASRDVKIDESRSVDLDAYLPQVLDPKDHYQLPERPIAIEAPLSHRRVRGQLGCFTVHGSSPQAIDEYFEEAAMPPYIGRIVLRAAGRRHAFLDPLLGWRINEEAIYQDLDSLAARIRREQRQTV